MGDKHVLAPSHRCPTCFRGELQPRLITEVIDHPLGDEVLLVEVRNVPVRECAACGERLSGPEAARLRDGAIFRALQVRKQ